MKLKNPAKGAFLQRFFKTGKGEYGFGDIFLGVTVPQQRVVASKFADLPLEDIKQMLGSKIHEFRLSGLLILVARYRNAEQREKKKIVQLYLNNRKLINNWDLVDSSAPYILGDYFLNRDKASLYKLAESKRIWDRRMAVLATYCFIRNGNFIDTFEIAKILLDDPHDLIHKAVGWMLREVGNRNAKEEEEFLRTHASRMPRTMLRYAMEKFPERKRKEIGCLVHRV